MGHLKAALVVLGMGLTTQLSAQDSVMLLDRSGSMKPYYDAGVVRSCVAAVERMAQGQTLDLAMFSTRAAAVASYEQVEADPYGADTYLDHALSHALDRGYGLAWILSDNIQDEAGSAAAGNTDVFYQQLRDDRVHRVTILPLKQPPGRAGLVIYGLLFDPAREDEYLQQTRRLVEELSSLSATEALRMKPLDRDTIEILVISSGTSEAPSRYEVGDTIQETIELRFRSKFEHLKIENATIEVSRSRADFGDDSLLIAEKSEVSITPVTIEVEPGAETDQVYQVTFDLGRIGLKKDPASLWEASFGRSREIQHLTLSFSINVPQRNFRFREPFLAQYNAASPRVAEQSGLVYGIENLPVLVGEQATLILSEKQIPVRIDYPFYPALIILLLLAGAAVAVVAAVYFGAGAIGGLLGGRDWRVTASDDLHRPLQCESMENGEVYVENERVGRISRSSFLVSEEAILREPETDSRLGLEDGMKVKLSAPSGRLVNLTFDAAAPQQSEDSSEQPDRRG